jgi:hypothetical protein
MNDQSSRPTPMAARVFLGAFILWQLFFLLSSNFVSLLPKAREDWAKQRIVQNVAPDWVEAKGPVAKIEQILTRVTSRWSELTGQPQNWSLFAPNVTDIIPFVAVEFCWEDDPSSVRSMSQLLAPIGAGHVIDEVSLGAIAWGNDFFDREKMENKTQLLWTKPSGGESPKDFLSPPDAVWRHHARSAWILFSDNEPRDKQRFVKFGHFRMRRYESCIDISPTSADKKPDAVVDVWREDIESRIRDRWPLMQAYMSWQLRRLLKDYPELPEPRQVILWARIYRVPPPEESLAPWTWQGPEWHPVARWQPGAEWADKHLPVEMFNPVVDRFESLRQREARHDE